MARTDWRAKEEKFKRGAVTVFDARRKAIARMAAMAWATASQSGAESLAIKKEKLFGFKSQYELEQYLDVILTEQQSLCALTGLALQVGDDDGEPELRCSLDRIDSNRHLDFTAPCYSLSAGFPVASGDAPEGTHAKEGRTESVLGRSTREMPRLAKAVPRRASGASTVEPPCRPI